MLLAGRPAPTTNHEGLDCVLADMARLPATLWPEPGPPLAKAHAIELGVVGRVHRLALDVRNLAVREKKTFEKVVLEGVAHHRQRGRGTACSTTGGATIPTGA